MAFRRAMGRCICRNDSYKKAEIFQEKLINNYLIHFPEVKRKKCSNDKPYINDAIKSLIRQKLRLFRQRKTEEANILRKSIKKQIWKASAQYYRNKVSELFKARPKQWYNTVKKISGKTVKNVDFNLDVPPETTANSLNRHLAAIVQTLPALSCHISPPPAPDQDIPVVQPADVEAKICKLKRTSICPLDIPIDLIKAFPDLSKPLSNIFNTITRSGSFPKCWKKGYITPIQKKGVKLDFYGVRPITLTPVFSKLYESFAADWLKNTILVLIDEQQFGNMKGLSTTHYLVSLLETVYKLLDEPDTWLNLLLIDLQKAFDLVSHNVLVEKLLNEFNVTPIF